jgi:hypothetical protein
MGSALKRHVWHNKVKLYSEFYAVIEQIYVTTMHLEHNKIFSRKPKHFAEYQNEFLKQ